MDIGGLDDEEEDDQGPFAQNFDLQDIEASQLKFSNVATSTTGSPNLSSSGVQRPAERIYTIQSEGSSTTSSIKRQGSTSRGGSRKVKIAAGPDAAISLQEEVDELMDHSIEIDSNKRIRKEHVHPWTLQFFQTDMESDVINIFFYTNKPNTVLSKILM